MNRICKKCSIKKNIEDFPIRSDNGKPKYICKECYNSYQRIENQKYYQKNSEFWRERGKKYREKLTETDKRNIHLMHNYGITQEEYEFLFKIQNSLCAICKKEDNKRGLFVDHNHETGKVRGLLCNKCNTAIALLDENKDYLMNAIKYLDFFVAFKIVG